MKNKEKYLNSYNLKFKIWVPFLLRLQKINLPKKIANWN